MREHTIRFPVLPCNSNLGAGIAELRERGVKEAVLLPERQVIRVGMSLAGLETIKAK